MLGFTMPITLDPAQIPNNQLAQIYSTGVAIQNMSPTYLVDLCTDDNFTPQYSYPLGPGLWYTYTGQKTFWARLNMVDVNGGTVPDNAFANCWINPGGAANIGGVGAGSQPVSIISPVPLPVSVVSLPATSAKMNARSGQMYSQIMPEATRLKLFHAVLRITDTGGELRYPTFEINMAGNRFRVPMSMLSLGMGAWEFTGIPGAFQPFQRYEDNLIVFPLPEIALPSETIISLPTRNFADTDRWQDIWTQSEL